MFGFSGTFAHLPPNDIDLRDLWFLSFSAFSLLRFRLELSFVFRFNERSFTSFLGFLRIQIFHEVEGLVNSSTLLTAGIP